MADKVGLTVIKKFTYRGDASEEFSNTYHFTGAIPADATAWRALFDALVAQEKTVYPSTVSVIRGYGYATDNEDDDSVFQVHLDGGAGNVPVPGTLTLTGGTLQAGDAAVWCRWKTSRTNTNGKPIFLRKYFHPAVMDNSVLDAVLPAQKTALNALATKLWDGTFLSGRKITAMHSDDTILASAASSYITVRQLKRRGKRPGS